MVNIKRKPPIRKGGRRVPSQLKYSTQRLLKVLWELHGGPHALSRKTGEPAQAFIGWRNKGKVSLKKTGKLARILGVPKESLNYEEVGEFHGQNNTWTSVVDQAISGHTRRDWVLKGIHPESFLGDEI